MSVQPNHFELKGADGTHVQYSISATGEHTLAVNGVAHVGSDVNIATVPMGALVTVTTLQSDGARRRHQFSLLIPRFSDDGNHGFTTLGIFTTDFESAVYAVDGALAKYQALELTGTARRVRGAHA